MALSQHQKDILRFVGNNTVTAKAIVDRFKGHYYGNGQHHVYERISRLVKRGYLIRVKRGYYCRGPGKNKPKQIDDGSQLTLF